MDDNTNSKDYKYILVDRTDPLLMWNSAVSIIVFILLLFFIFTNWKPKCSKVGLFEDMTRSFDLRTIEESVGGDRFI
jgi:hypothetical protein